MNRNEVDEAITDYDKKFEEAYPEMEDNLAPKDRGGAILVGAGIVGLILYLFFG